MTTVTVAPPPTFLPPTTGNAILVNGTNWFVATAAGVFRRTRAGNWEPVGSALPAVRALYEVDGQIWAASTTGVHVCGPDGDDWERVLSVADCTSITTTGAGVIAIGTANDGVFRSPDRGQTWSGASVGLADFATRELISIGDRLVCLGGRGVQRESSAGTWGELQLPDIGVTSVASSGSALLVVSPDGLWHQAAEDSPWLRIEHWALTPELAMVGLLRALGDGGCNERIGIGSPRADLNESSILYLDADGVREIAAGESVPGAALPIPSHGIGELTATPDGLLWRPMSGGVLHSSDGGVTWITAPDAARASMAGGPEAARDMPAPVRELHQTDVGDVLAIVERNDAAHTWTGLLRAPDMLGPWSPVLTSTALAPIVLCTEGSHMWVVSGSQVLHADLRAGRRPERIGEIGEAGGGIVAMSILSAGDLLIAGTSRGVWLSGDDGRTWSACTDAPVEPVTAIAALPTVIVAVTADGSVWRLAMETLGAGRAAS